MPKLELVKTADGSHSLYRSDIEETYHSNHGAYEESMHVYIREGIDFYLGKFAAKKELRIFEMGFGTGLNALLTLRTAEERPIQTVFHSIELYPVPQEIMRELNYAQLPGLEGFQADFERLIEAPWNEDLRVSPSFEMKKIEGDLFEYRDGYGSFDILYYDAFGLRAQPEVWQSQAFQVCFQLLRSGGILVTYASNGEGRRAMQKAGFEVEKLPGAVGKREMIRASKP